jgi:polysaccharide export outer membrane protein
MTGLKQTTLAAQLLFVASMPWLMGGCYDAGQVQAFLQAPRSPVASMEYRFLPPDQITITSTAVPEVNGFTSQVRPDGKINLPLMGEIYVAGRTPKEVETAVAEAARKYYERVDVTVQVAGYRSRKFFVFGEVARPGPLPWTGCDSLLDVLAQVQPTRNAWPERIIIVRSAEPTQGGYACAPSTQHSLMGVHPAGTRPIRPSGAGGPTSDADGGKRDPNHGIEPATQPGTTLAAATGQQPFRKPYRLTVNLTAMVEHGDMANNILLMPNDVVYVQPNPFAKFSFEVEKVSMPVRAVTNGLSDFRELTNNIRWIQAGMPGEDFGGRIRLVGGTVAPVVTPP